MQPLLMINRKDERNLQTVYSVMKVRLKINMCTMAMTLQDKVDIGTESQNVKLKHTKGSGLNLIVACLPIIYALGSSPLTKLQTINQTSKQNRENWLIWR